MTDKNNAANTEKTAGMTAMDTTTAAANASPVIANRIECFMLTSCTNSNPNGDPDMANAPRTDPDTMTGLMTGECQKRRIRDYVGMFYPEEPGMDIYVKCGTDLNTTMARARVAADIPLTDKTTAAVSAANRAMCANYWDVRTIGATMGSGPNNGQVTGPVSIGFATSLDPVQPMDLTLTRVASSEASGKTIEDYENYEAKTDADKLRTFGRRQVIPYGLYATKAFVSPGIAERTGCTEKDFDILTEAMANMWETLHTSSKSDMHMAGPLVIFKHVGEAACPAEDRPARAKKGVAPAHKLFELIKITKKPGVEIPRSYRDYDCVFEMSRVPEGIQVGFRAPFANEISWGKLPDGEDWMVLA